MSLNRTQLFEVLRDAFNRSYPGDSQATLETLANLLTPVWDGSVAYSVKSAIFDGGAIGDGVTSDRDAIQAALDWSSQNRQAISIPDGDYLIDSPLYARSYASVVCTPQARLIRNFSQTGTTGLLTNETMTTPISNFRWSGGVIRNASPSTLTGNSVCLNADDSYIENLYVDEWSSTGRAMLLFGNRLVVDRARAVSLNDGGGIRYAGGDDFRCMNSYVHCGDDCFQYVPGAAAGGILFDQTIRRGQYIGCHGYSWNARLCVAGLVGTGGVLHMAGSILDCAFIGIRGRSGRVGITIENEDSTGKIARLSLTDIMVDCTEAAAASTGGCFISSTSGTGGVEDVWLTKVTVLGPLNEALQITGAATKRVSTTGCYFDASRTPGTRTAIIQGMTGFTSRGTYWKGNGGNVVQIGNGADVVTDAQFLGDEFVEIDNALSGLFFSVTTHGAVRDCRFTQRSGQTSARAINLSPGAAGTGAVKIDIDAASCNFDGLSLAEPIILNTTTSAENRILNNGVARIHTGNSTLRRYESGQTRIANSGSSITFTLPTPSIGIEFTIQAQGAGGVVVQAGAGDTIRINASTSTSGGTATGPQGCAMRLIGTSATEWMASGTIGTWVLA